MSLLARFREAKAQKLTPEKVLGFVREIEYAHDELVKEVQAEDLEERDENRYLKIMREIRDLLSKVLSLTKQIEAALKSYDSVTAKRLVDEVESLLQQISTKHAEAKNILQKDLMYEQKLVALSEDILGHFKHVTKNLNN